MKRMLTCLVLCTSGAAPLHAQTLRTEPIEMPGQVVVCFESTGNAFDLDATVAQWDLQAVDASLRVQEARSLLQWRRRGETVFTNVVLVEYAPASIDAVALRRRIDGIPDVRWAAPNSALTGEVKELIPDDPQYGARTTTR
ncbi:MAG: hypothetical protein GY711_25760 [bacterium]|nr:hypothetical protein [bacterium]